MSRMAMHWQRLRRLDIHALHKLDTGCQAGRPRLKGYANWGQVRISSARTTAWYQRRLAVWPDIREACSAMRTDIGPAPLAKFGHFTIVGCGLAHQINNVFTQMVNIVGQGLDAMADPFLAISYPM